MNEEALSRLRCPECGPEGHLTPGGVIVENEAGEWEEALLRCSSCSRPFRVEEGVADLVRDGLREIEAEAAFFHRHGIAIPEEIHRRSALHPENASPDREADLRIIEEGRHWGRFMRRFWDVGDRSIFDIREKGSHPPFYVAGVLEPDDRDTRRRWGVYPPRTGEACFSALAQLAGKWGVDVGCGGGQFGLEAAWQGVRMIGFDPSFEELSLARRHAREVGVSEIDYVRGEPANPPLAPGAFALLMAKDALHHVPGLREEFPRVLGALEPGARIIVHEHVARARLKEALLNRLRPAAVRKIRSRYRKVEVPEELLRDSANEDAGAEAVREVLDKHAVREGVIQELYLAEELEALAYFALGKRRWLAAIARGAGRVLEPVLHALGDRQHLTWTGHLPRH